WTGLTQQQSGMLFRGKSEILNRPRPAPAHGVPAQGAGSVAVAESHAYIVHALRFAHVLPASTAELPRGWASPGFDEAATTAVTSDARLVFVHVLRVDTAGHRASGQGSPGYDEAARTADALLGQLMDAARAAHPTGTRWFVLSDHGHRGAALIGRAGGHGGSEPAIRQVRGCITGALDHEPPVRPGTYIHLVDMARAIADSLGVTLSPGAAGRPLHAAAAAPVETDATLPSPSPGR